MKITSNKTEPTFTPVSFTVTCETQEELDRWWCIFNHIKITYFLNIDYQFLNILSSLGAKKDGALWYRFISLFK